MKKMIHCKKHTNSKKKKVLYNILFFIALIAFIISAYMLIKILILDPNANKDLNKEIQDVHYSEPSPFEKLLTINSDIKGWIKIDNTPIDYPVLYSDYYLRRDYNKQYTKYGSIFIDNTCKLENNPQNILLHGHHMQDGSMFAKICDFTDLNFYKTTPVFTFDTIYESGIWKIISIYRTNTNSAQGEIFNYLQSEFESDHSDFLEYVYQVKIRSNIDTPVDIAKDDKLVTLSTCSYELPDFRTVLVARKARAGESQEVDTSRARYSDAPLMPDAYYQKYGGSKPNVTSFKDALSKNKINWYKET
ncbi:MAG: hypothetical protein RUMPE_00037 [Eubacteriales bacterium SKADARSKE-1]|nr:hypothetical protein [Eubacteriales bacterium SKADARSKE-1]